MVRSDEPLWLGDDRAKAMAYIRWQREDQAERCSRCGTREEDWLDDAGRRRVDDIWEAAASRCPGCAEIAGAWARIRGNEPEATAGVDVFLRSATDSPEDPVMGVLEMVQASKVGSEEA